MGIIAVAGGTGKLGRAIVHVLVAQKQHQIIVLGRESHLILSKELGAAIIEIDYSDVDDISRKLEHHHVDTVISTLSSMAGLEPELNLIKGSEKATTTRRYIPSFWHIKYSSELFDIYPVSRTKIAILDALEKTALEYTAIFNGFFLDYLLGPHSVSYVSPLPAVIDMTQRVATIPGSGNVPVVFSYTFDVAKFVAAALNLPKWDKESYVIGGRATWNQFLDIAEEVTGSKFKVFHDSVEDLSQGKITELPSHALLYPLFPKQSLQGLLATFGIMFERGYFDLKPAHTLNDAFPNIKIKTIKGHLEDSWQREWSDKGPMPRKLE